MEKYERSVINEKETAKALKAMRKANKENVAAPSIFDDEKKGN